MNGHVVQNFLSKLIETPKDSHNSVYSLFPEFDIETYNISQFGGGEDNVPGNFRRTKKIKKKIMLQVHGCDFQDHSKLRY